jgi:hypothetical protein
MTKQSTTENTGNTEKRCGLSERGEASRTATVHLAKNCFSVFSVFSVVQS